MYNIELLSDNCDIFYSSHQYGVILDSIMLTLYYKSGITISMNIIITVCHINAYW